MCGGGGGGDFTQERFSNFSNTIFPSREITGKNLSTRKNIIGNITLTQTSRLNLDKEHVQLRFGVKKSPVF